VISYGYQLFMKVAYPTLVWVNVWHADLGLRPPGGGLTGAIPLCSIVPCRRPTKIGTVGQWRRLGKPQTSPDALLCRIAPFRAWDFHLFRCGVNARERTTYPY